MDSLRGIPVEHKLETFSMPSTGTTSCHPKNWLCRSERNPALDTLATISPLVTLMEIRILSSKYQIKNYTVTLNTSLTRPTTCCHLNILLSHFVSNIQQALTPRVLQHQKQTKYSMLQIKNFRCCVVKAKFHNSFVCLKKYS